MKKICTKIKAAYLSRKSLKEIVSDREGGVKETIIPIAIAVVIAGVIILALTVLSNETIEALKNAILDIFK